MRGLKCIPPSIKKVKGDKMQEKETKEMEAMIDFKDILGIGMTIVVTVIGMAYGAQVTSDIKSDMTANTLEYNISGYGLTGLKNLSVKIPTMATVLAAAIILGIVVRYLWGSFMG